MARINEEELIKLAQISSLEIIEDEIPMFIEKISAVLNYAQRVQKLAQEPTKEEAAVRNENVFREDISLVCEPEQILALAPEKEDAYFVVPQIIKQT